MKKNDIAGANPMGTPKWISRELTLTQCHDFDWKLIQWWANGVCLLGKPFLKKDSYEMKDNFFAKNYLP